SVNHRESVKLDSSDAFEGPEKLLEVWFAPFPVDMPNGTGLLSISRDQWESMLDLVQCKVLSVVSNNMLRAFLLSESSMFVFPHKLILKTCGTTTLLVGIERIIELATSVGFSSDPYQLFYSRKEFLFPDRQLHPHRSWEEEVSHLDQYFPDGAAYSIGKVNSPHHWHLYMKNASCSPTEASEVIDELFDETLEILMTDLSRTKCSNFFAGRIGAAHKATAEETAIIDDAIVSSDDDSINSFGPCTDSLVAHDSGHVLGNVVCRESGIANIYPEAIIDSFTFLPCGYSCNGFIPDSDKYLTIHVTPEEVCSYASFETNVPVSATDSTGRKTTLSLNDVVDIFLPGRFSVTLFQSKRSANKRLNSLKLTAAGYTRVDRIVHDFGGYELVYADFVR
ncbi:hypothetical protein CANCADRAFT_17174, partial [Tortispora caseinolytica NRRL Y-17796]